GCKVAASQGLDATRPCLHTASSTTRRVNASRIHWHSCSRSGGRRGAQPCASRVRWPVCTRRPGFNIGSLCASLHLPLIVMPLSPLLFEARLKHGATYLQSPFRD